MTSYGMLSGGMLSGGTLSGLLVKRAQRAQGSARGICPAGFVPGSRANRPAPKLIGSCAAAAAGIEEPGSKQPSPADLSHPQHARSALSPRRSPGEAGLSCWTASRRHERNLKKACINPCINPDMNTRLNAGKRTSSEGCQVTTLPLGLGFNLAAHGEEQRRTEKNTQFSVRCACARVSPASWSSTSASFSSPSRRTDRMHSASHAGHLSVRALIAAAAYWHRLIEDA